MSLWLTILRTLLEEKLIPAEDNLGERIRMLLYGSLTTKDLDFADSILIHVFGRDFKVCVILKSQC